MTDESRKAFEAWYFEPFNSVSAGHPEDIAWQAWQARDAEVAELQARAKELDSLQDGANVWANILRGTIGRPAAIDEYFELRARLAAIEAEGGPEPLCFLAENHRFKLSFDSKGRVSALWSFANELDGRWVALVPAEDDLHMRILRAAEHTALRVVELEERNKALVEALDSMLPGLILDRRYATPDDDTDAMDARIETVRLAIAANAVKEQQ